MTRLACGNAIELSATIRSDPKTKLVEIETQALESPIAQAIIAARYLVA